MSTRTFDIDALDRILDQIEHFDGSDLDEARRYSADLQDWLARRTADGQSTQSDLDSWRGGLNYLLGHFAYADGDVASATDFFLEATRANALAGDAQREVKSLRRLALCHEYAGRQTESIDCVFRALRVAENLGDARTLAKALTGLLALYESQGAYQQALETSLQLHTTAAELDDLYLLASASLYTALFCGYLDRGEDGLEWVDQAIEIAETGGLPHVVVQSQIYQMWLFGVAGRIDEAVDAADRQLDIIRALPAQNAAATYVDVAEIYVEAGEIDRAGHMLQLADEAAGDQRLNGHLIRYFKVAADLHEARGETATALRMLRRHVELDHELRGEQAKARLATIERRFAAELAAKSDEIHQLRTVELVEKNNQLSALIQQKDEILDVVVHDLRNPLTATQLLGESLLVDLSDDLSDDAADRLKSIGSAAIEMRESIDTLVDALRGGAQSMLSPVSAAVEAAVVQIQKLAASRSVSIEFVRNDAGLVVNSALLRRSLDDLFGLAVKSSPPESVLTITVGPLDDGARITIAGSDGCNGERWSAERLYIARRLVERMRGTLTLTQSTDPEHPTATIDLRS